MKINWFIASLEFKHNGYGTIFQYNFLVSRIFTYNCLSEIVRVKNEYNKLSDVTIDSILEEEESDIDYCNDLNFKFSFDD